MPFTCTVCQGNLFLPREVKINTTTAELFNVGWANQSAYGLTCVRCGYLHEFVAPLEHWQPENGYPEATGWIQ